MLERTTTRAQYFGRISFAALVGFAGLWVFIEDRTARHVQSEGLIVNLVEYHGRGAFSNFDLQSADGHLSHVRSDYAGDHLLNGEHAQAETLSFNATLLHLRILDGPYAGWEVTETDNRWMGFAGVIFALIVLIWARPLKAKSTAQQQ